VITEKVEIEIAGGLSLALPKMLRVKQKFNADAIHDVAQATGEALRKGS